MGMEIARKQKIKQSKKNHKTSKTVHNSGKWTFATKSSPNKNKQSKTTKRKEKGENKQKPTNKRTTARKGKRLPPKKTKTSLSIFQQDIKVQGNQPDKPRHTLTATTGWQRQENDLIYRLQVNRILVYRKKIKTLGSFLFVPLQTGNLCLIPKAFDSYIPKTSHFYHYVYTYRLFVTGYSLAPLKCMHV